VEPEGQGDKGAVITPPDTVHPETHELFVIETLDGAPVNTGQAGAHETGLVVADAIVEVQLVALSLQRANTVTGVGKYEGTIPLHGPAGLVAHSSTVPVPHPDPEIVPVVDGHILSVMVMTGCVGVRHTPGTVVTGADSGLVTVVFKSHEQRVLIVCAGPVWL